MINRLRAWWLFFWCTRVRNHFCFHCDRSTYRVHDHHAEQAAELNRILGPGWWT